MWWAGGPERNPNAGAVPSDSPHPHGDLILPWWVGAALGAGAGAGLAAFGQTSIPVGIGVGAVFGWLYALCQHRTNPLGFVLVGVSYGITIWIMTHLVLKIPHAAEAWPMAVEGKGNLGRCVAFGEALALAAMLYDMAFGRTAVNLPKD